MRSSSPLFRFVPAFAMFATGMLAGTAQAQDPQVRVRTMEAPRAMTFAFGNANRAIIGVGLATGGAGDTLGLEVTEVTEDGPAAKAGITTGSRIQAINGVSLRISAADASDPLTSDAGYRRLQRELGKAKPGDNVTLQVLSNGQSRTVTVTTTSASDMASSRVATTFGRSRELLARRAALGISLGGGGSVRDTLGVFVTSVTADGPAEKAGIIEGERIVSINGVDVRVPKEDVGDGAASSARISRFLRELDKVAPGDQVNLRVHANGRTREVTVTAAKASEVGSSMYRFEMDGGPTMMIRGLLDDAMRGGVRGLDELAVPRRIQVVPAVPSTPRAPLAPTRARSARVVRMAL